MDNFYTGRRKNIESLMVLPNFTLIEQDVQKPIDLEIDEIYHAASPASPPHYQKSPTFTTKTILLGTLNMLDLAQEYDAKMLQFSTSEVYGDPLVHPQVESYYGNVNPHGVRSCYDEGKRCSESLCFDYHREFGTRVKVIRIFNTYGPKMDPDDGRVVSNFIMQALQGMPLTVYGDGQQTRSFCYVDDLVDGIMRMMATPDSFMGPINLGNDGEFTLLELAEKIIDKTRTTSKLAFYPLPFDDPTQRKPNIDLAKLQLDWEPAISLDQGLDKTIAYFSGYIDEEDDREAQVI